MDQIQKFLRRLNTKQQKQLKNALRLLSLGTWETLDIKRLQGGHDWYRCRVGQMRIVFFRLPDSNIQVMNVEFRGNVYKKIS